MYLKKSPAATVLSALSVFFLILDAQTAFDGASQGMALCIRTVIPSLFPLFFLCGIMNSYFLGTEMKPLRPIGKLCGIPCGAESLFLIGITGGYPVGAKNVFTSYYNGMLSREAAERMLGFCSNAGPAFLFGMTSLLFPHPAAPWLLWFIQIVCALLTAMILPGKSNGRCAMSNKTDLDISKILRNALLSMSTVCGWVILFRVLIQILDRWVLWLIPTKISVWLTGLLELSNGCIMLGEVESLPLRFTVAAVITVFGGLCVYLQTVSVCKTLSCKIYLIGKLIQTALSIPLAMISSTLLFPGNDIYLRIGVLLGACLIVVYVIIRKIKICTGNPALYHV